MNEEIPPLEEPKAYAEDNDQGNIEDLPTDFGDENGEKLSGTLISNKEADAKVKQYMPEQIEDAKKRYRFYQARTDKNPSGSAPELTEAEADILKARVAVTDIMKPENEIAKSPEIIEKLHRIIKRIIDFAHKELGIELTEANFAAIDNIHLMRDEDFPEEKRYSMGVTGQNEICIRIGMHEDELAICENEGMKPEEIEGLADLAFEVNVEHELIHSACTQKVYLGESNNDRTAIHYSTRHGLSASLPSKAKMRLWSTCWKA